MLAYEVVASVDWITTTNKEKLPWQQWVGVSKMMVKSWSKHVNEGLIDEGKAEGIRGYEGWRCGSIFYGCRHDGQMAQVSGHAADVLFYHAASLGHCTRLDLALTINFGVEFDLATAMYDTIRSNHDSRGVVYVEPALTLDRKRGNKLVVGARSSEKYIRVYNKTREGKDERYAEGYWWRIEIECKASAAVSAMDRVMGADSRARTILATVGSECARRGYGIDALGLSEYSALPLVTRGRIDSTDEKKLQWLSTQVRPTIRKLKESGYTQESLMGWLGLDEGDV